MVLEIVNEEHVPENAPVVAAVGQHPEGFPDGARAHKGSDLPENQYGNHVSRPNPDKPVQDTATIEGQEVLGLADLVDEPDRDQKSSNPEEGVDCEVSSGAESGDSRSGEYLGAVEEILDIENSKPHIMTHDDPHD